MISHATIIGRSHRLMQHNCQDFAITATPTANIALGLVSDGCGSKFQQNGRAYPSHNEIGANLIGQFASDFLAQRLAARPQPPCPDGLETLLAELHTAVLAFLHHLVAHFSPETRQQFVATRLLATLVGFIRTPETAVFF